MQTLLLALACLCFPCIIVASCVPPSGCSVALAYYIASANETFDSIATRFHTTLANIQLYNSLPNSTTTTPGQIVYIPYPCSCTQDLLGYRIPYTIVSGDTLANIVQLKFNNLSQVAWILAVNDNVDPLNLQPGYSLTIPLNCSCGNPDVSSKYGMFTTYVAEEGDDLTSLSQKFGIDSQMLIDYNTNYQLNQLMAYSDIIFVPAKDLNGVYPPFNSSANGTGHVNRAALVGSLVGGAILVAIVIVLLSFWFYSSYTRKTINRDKQALIFKAHDPFIEVPDASQGSVSSGNSAVDKVYEFSYQELARITDNFNDAKKIGAGGFGAVYYGEVDGKKVAIKMMGVKAAKQFLAELQVLTRVNHSRLVQLVGYCAAESLFLVYEFVENKTLKHHLEAFQREGNTPLTWDSRVQIAIDTATGLEYIHEHTTPTYVHLDIKPENILLENNFRAKIADFGLAKLSEVAGTINLIGTRGYMAPEYATFGEISPKADVYSFGVVLLQLISAKEAVHTMHTKSSDRIALPSLFEGVTNGSDAKTKLTALIDPALGDDYPMDSVLKVTEIATACTSVDPSSRPSMKAVVSALTTISSSTQEWVVNPTLWAR